MRGAPQVGFFPAHLANQIPNLTRNNRASGLAVLHFPCPEQAKALAMPGHNRFRLHDDQGRAPIAQETGEKHPEESIKWHQPRAFPGRPLEHADLVAQGQVLELEFGSGANHRTQSEEC
jgi:hypothetical protein